MQSVQPWPEQGTRATVQAQGPGMSALRSVHLSEGS